MACPDSADYRRLVDGVAKGDDHATSELVTRFQRGLVWFLSSQVAPDAEDLAQDVLLEAIAAIRAGRLDDPDRLAGYIRAIAHHKVCAKIGEYRTQRERFVDVLRFPLPANQVGPEEQVIINQRSELALKMLNELRPRDREVLRRFYLDGQSPEQICREMGLSDTQFRLLKSRAKERVAKLGQRRASGRISILKRFATA